MRRRSLPSPIASSARSSASSVAVTSKYCIAHVSVLRRGIELQDQPLHALQQGVVQFAGDPFSLHKAPFHVVLHSMRRLPKPQLIQSPGHRQKSGRAQGTESQSLSSGRRPAPGAMEKANEQCCGLVPHAFHVAGRDAEAVVAWRKIRIERLSAIADPLPVSVPAFQLVAKMDLFRRDVAERGIVDLQIANLRRKVQVRATRLSP